MKPAALLLSALLLVSLAAAGLLWLARTNLTRVLVTEQERTRRAEDRVARLEARLGTSRRDRGSLQARLWQAEREMEDLNKTLDDLLERRDRAAAAAAPATGPEKQKEEQAQQERWEHQRTMARLAGSLNRALIDSGYTRLRIFSIGSRTAQDLRQVQLHHLDREGLVSRALRLESLYISLAPAVRELRLHAPRGRALEQGRWQAFGDQGWQLVLKDIEPGIWEHLGYSFLRVLPRPAPPVKPATGPDPALLAALKRQVNALLARERCLQQRHYKLLNLAGTRGRSLTGVELLGYTAKGRLVERFKAKRLDLAGQEEGGVRLILTGGTRFCQAGDLPLPPSGYLIMLPRAPAGEWRRLLPGRVD